MHRALSSIFSSYFGKFASKEFPKPIQNFINNSYVKLLGLDMREFLAPSEYKSLKELFIRAYKKPKEIDACITSVVSPCDAQIVGVGKIKQNKAYQIKTMEYKINELLDIMPSSKVLEEGEFINFYLSPKDYHRYHMPFDVRVLSVKYIPGKLYPVNLPFLKRKKNLYIENERVVIEVLDRFNKRHFIVLVGALNVGKMVVLFEKRVKTNSGMKAFHITYKEPILLKKGELFGWFEMGSTIVIVSEKDAIKWSVSEGEKVQFPQVIGELNDEN